LVNFKEIKELPSRSLVGASTHTRQDKEPRTKSMNMDFIKILGDIILSCQIENSSHAYKG
jgi:hypothetical protein